MISRFNKSLPHFTRRTHHRRRQPVRLVQIFKRWKPFAFIPTFSHKNPKGLFEKACAKGSIKVVKRLLKNKKIDPTANDYAALSQAYRFERGDVIRLLQSDDRFDDEAISSTEWYQHEARLALMKSTEQIWLRQIEGRREND